MDKENGRQSRVDMDVTLGKMRVQKIGQLSSRTFHRVSTQWQVCTLNCLTSYNTRDEGGLNWDQDSGEVETNAPKWNLGSKPTEWRAKNEGGEVEDGSLPSRLGGWVMVVTTHKRDYRRKVGVGRKDNEFHICWVAQAKGIFSCGSSQGANTFLGPPGLVCKLIGCVQWLIGNVK